MYFANMLFFTTIYPQVFFLFSKMAGPEPEYHKVVSGYKTFTTEEPFKLKYHDAVLPELTIAYETWGTLNEAKDNVVIVHAGLSASSHAKSHEVWLHTQFINMQVLNSIVS